MTFCPDCGASLQTSFYEHCVAKHPGKGRLIVYTPPVYPKAGSVIRVRYKDHVFFKESDSDQQTPKVLEAVGRLEYENDEFVRLIWEQYPDPGISTANKLRSTGLTVLKSTIVELRSVSDA
jgi:hypothetical protein